MKLDFNVIIEVEENGEFKCAVRQPTVLNKGSIRLGDNIPFLVGQTVNDYVSYFKEEVLDINKQSKINMYKSVLLTETDIALLEQAKQRLLELEAS